MLPLTIRFTKDTAPSIIFLKLFRRSKRSKSFKRLKNSRLSKKYKKKFSKKKLFLEGGAKGNWKGLTGPTGSDTSGGENLTYLYVPVSNKKQGVNTYPHIHGSSKTQGLMFTLYKGSHAGVMNDDSVENYLDTNIDELIKIIVSYIFIDRNGPWVSDNGTNNNPQMVFDTMDQKFKAYLYSAFLAINGYADLSKQKTDDSTIEKILTQVYNIYDLELNNKDIEKLWFTPPYHNWALNMESLIYIRNLYNNFIKQNCITNRILCFDLSSEIEKKTNYFYDDIHFTKQGNILIGKLIHEFLRQEFKSF